MEWVGSPLPLFVPYFFPVASPPSTCRVVGRPTPGRQAGVGLVEHRVLVSGREVGADVVARATGGALNTLTPPVQ